MKPQGSTPTLAQRKGIARYQEIQRSARSEYRANASNVIDFRCPPGTPGSEPQTLSRLDTKRFWLALALIVIAVFVARCMGWR